MIRWVLMLAWMLLPAAWVGAAQVAEPSASGSASPELDAAVAHYRSGAFDDALEAFARLAAAEDDPARRAVLHANAGTAAARRDDLGAAVWHLREALRQAPRDPVARRNLDLVRARMGSGPSEPVSLTDSLRRLPLWLTADEVARLGGYGGLLALLLVAGWRARLLPRGAAWLALAVGVAVLGLLWASRDARAEEARQAVVMGPLAVRGEPQADGRVILRLGPGELVQVDQRRDAWTLVQVPSGGRGWAPSEQLRGE